MIDSSSRKTVLPENGALVGAPSANKEGSPKVRAPIQRAAPRGLTQKTAFSGAVTCRSFQERMKRVQRFRSTVRKCTYA